MPYLKLLKPFLLCSSLLFMGFSCSDNNDDNPDTPDIPQGEFRLKTISSPYGDIVYSYDEEGRLTTVDDRRNDITTDYSYNPLQITISSLEERVTVSNLKFNSKGYLLSARSTDGWDEIVTSFEYDGDYLSKIVIKDSEGYTETQYFVWENGVLMKWDEDYSYDDPDKQTVTYTYSSEENPLGQWSYYYQFGFSGLNELGWLGKCPAKFLKSMRIETIDESDGDIHVDNLTFSYTFTDNKLIATESVSLGSAVEKFTYSYYGSRSSDNRFSTPETISDGGLYKKVNAGTSIFGFRKKHHPKM